MPQPLFSIDPHHAIADRQDRDDERDPHRHRVTGRDLGEHFRRPAAPPAPLPTAVAAAILASTRAVFTQKGLTISDDLLRELANNSAQSVVFLLGERGLEVA